MTISTRSRVLLVASGLVPITVAYFRIASLAQRRVLANRVRVVLGDFTGLVPNALILLGILFFIGFVTSILNDYFRSR